MKASVSILALAFILAGTVAKSQSTPGSLDTEFDSNGFVGNGPGGTVNVIEIQPDGKVLMGGPFTQYAGVDRKRMARANADGTLDLDFDTGLGFGPDPGSDSQVRDIIYHEGKIYVLGDFTLFNGDSANHIIRLNDDGSKDTDFDSGTGLEDEPGNTYRTLGIQSSGQILVGGRFSDYNDLDIGFGNLYRLNPDGSFDPTFVPPVSIGDDDSEVTKILVLDDDKILVAFSSLNGAVNHLVKLEPDGNLVSEFETLTFDEEVLALAIQKDEKVIAAGLFWAYGPNESERIVRINTDGSYDDTFDIGWGFYEDVYDIGIQPDGKILVAGDFGFFDDNPASKLIRLHTNGTKDADFNVGSGFNGAINSIRFTDDYQIYCGGAFTSVQSTDFQRTVRLFNSIVYISDYSPQGVICSGTEIDVEIAFQAYGHFGPGNEFQLNYILDEDDPSVGDSTDGTSSGTLNLTLPDGALQFVSFWVSATEPEIEADGFGAQLISMTPSEENWVDVDFDPSGLCLGSELEFIGNSDFSGNFQWLVNGNQVATGPIFSTNSLENGDEVVLSFTTTEECVLPPTMTTPEIEINLPVSQSEVTVTVMDSNGPVEAMAVEWYDTEPLAGEIAYVLTATSTTDENGEVVFENVPPGVYKVRALPDFDIEGQIQYITTWYPQEFGWVWGEEITIGCETDWNETITLIMADLTDSLDVIVGGLIQSGTNRSLIGDPIPGIPIIIQNDTTSLANVPFVMNFTGNNGVYNFNHLPAGDYQVYLDMPGLPIIETHYFSVQEGQTFHYNLDFCVDSLQGIFKGVNCSYELVDKNRRENLRVFPNPFHAQTEIILPDWWTTANVKMAFYASNGREISPAKSRMSNGRVYLDFSNAPSGLILYNVWNERERYSGKLMKE